MESQVQSLKQLAELITSDLVDRLQLSSASAAAKLISGDLRKLVGTSTVLSKGVDTLNTTLKDTAASSTTSFNLLRQELSSLTKTSVGVISNVAKLSESLKRSVTSSKGPQLSNETLSTRVEETNKTVVDPNTSRVPKLDSTSKEEQPKPQQRASEFGETLKSILQAISSSTKPVQSEPSILAERPSLASAVLQQPTEKSPQKDQTDAASPSVTTRESTPTLLQGIFKQLGSLGKLNAELAANFTKKLATPVTSASVAPTPLTPTPVTPASVTPTPLTPTPVTPASVAPTPSVSVTPTPLTPTPVTPASVAPTPSVSVTPVSVAPTTPASAALTAPIPAAKESSATVLQGILNRLEALVKSNAELVAIKSSANNSDKNNTKAEPPTLLQNILKQTENFLKSFKSQPTATTSVDPTKPKSELIITEKPKEVIIAGFSEQALRGLSLPSLVDGFKDISKTLHDIEGGIGGLASNNKNIGEDGGDMMGSALFASFFAKLKPILPILGGSAVLLAGIGSLVAAFNTDGEAKGTLELIGKGGVKAGLAILAKTAFKKVGEGMLKKIPLIGSVISMGFAFQRFSKGDTIGGILEVGSALAGLIPVPGVGLAISTGIDILQAVMDAKAGGSSAEASAKKGDILLDWAKKIGTFVDAKIKYVPIIGPLYETGRALLKGDWKKAFLEFITVVPALQAVKFIMGEEQFNAKAEEVTFSIGSWLKGIGNFIDEKISYIPILGPLYNTGKALLKGDYKRALFEFATLNPALQFAKAFMTEDEIQQASEGIAFNVKEWLNKVGNWIYEKTENLPIIGPLVKAAKKAINDPLAFVEALPGGKTLLDAFNAVSKGDYVEAFKLGTNVFAEISIWIRSKLKELPVIGPLMEAIETASSIPEFIRKLPGGNSIMDLFEFATSGKVIETAAGAASNLFKSVVDWIQEKLTNLPVIGPLIKAIQNAVNDPMEFLKSLPGGGLIVSFIEGAKELAGSAMDAAGNLASSMAGKIQGLFSSIGDSIMEAFLNLIPEKFGVAGISFPLRDRVKAWMGIKGANSSATSDTKQLASTSTPAANNQKGANAPAAPTSSTDTVKQLQDSAIDPAGGLIISSPQLGSLYQLNKKDGIVSGPATESSPLTPAKRGNGFATMESLLEKIVTNTFVTNQNMSNLITGFNKMAKALQEKIGEDISVPMVVNQQSSAPGPSFTQYANAGNGEISNFRSSVIEGSRFQPA